MKELGEPLVEQEPPATVRIPLPRWVTLLLGLVAVGLVPWTLYLTFALPSRHLTFHYDLAWVGFDVALTASFAATAWATLRGSQWLVPLAAVTGTMLVCDAWFDILSSQPGGERLMAVVLAVLVELPSALVCLLIARHVEEVAERAQRYALVARRLRPRRRAATAGVDEAPTDTS